MVENITYARGVIVELSDEIEMLKAQISPIKSAMCTNMCKEEPNTKELRALLDDYDVKAKKISDAYKRIFELKEKWGIK